MSDPNDPSGFGPGGKPSLWKILARVNAIWEWLQSSGYDQISKQLDRMEAKMTAMDDNITALQADVAADTTAVASAITLIDGFAAQLAAAIAAAQAAGGTPAQLQALTDLHTAVTANTAGLSAAVAANTPPPPAGP